MNTKYTKSTATPRFDLEKNRGSINISANPISEMKTADVVVGINLQVNKSIAMKLFFLFEEQTELLLGEIHLMKSAYVKESSLLSEGNLEHEHTINEACDKIHEQISMYKELRYQVLTALIGEQD